MRLWSLGKTKSLAWNKYAAYDNSHDALTLHLFRALLRQASYLPDSAARQYFRHYIVSRFREYHPCNPLNADSGKGRPVTVVESRRPALLRTARKGLVFLQRATDGHPRHLSKVLAMTYGRIGKRRHILLKSLKIPDIPMDQASIEKLSKPRSQGLPQPSRQLSAMVKAQAKRKLAFFSRTNTPSLKPQIPLENAWGRPMPVKRVRSMTRKWYAKTLDRIMPPLPEDEWHRLRRLASGETQWEGPVRRRGHVKVDQFKHDIVRGTIVGGTGFVSSPHVLTPRYMRRLWAKLLAQCPLMKSNESRKLGWDIQWGDIQGSKIVKLQPRAGHNSAMFEGVDENGRILQGG